MNSPTVSAKTITAVDEVNDDLADTLSKTLIADDENTQRSKAKLFPTAHEEDAIIDTNLRAAKGPVSDGVEPEKSAVNAGEEKSHVSTEETPGKGEVDEKSVKG